MYVDIRVSLSLKLLQYAQFISYTDATSCFICKEQGRGFIVVSAQGPRTLSGLSVRPCLKKQVNGSVRAA